MTRAIIGTLKIVVIYLGCSVSRVASSQQPNLDELQKRLDDATKAHEQKRRAAATPSRASQARPGAPGSPKAKPAGGSFVVQGNALRDSTTGLLWAQSDNGGDIDWYGAKGYCERTSGWRLPTVEELASLFNGKLPGVRCGPELCKVPNELQLTSPWLWSSERKYVSVGSSFSSNLGENVYARPANTRALCVRST